MRFRLEELDARHDVALHEIDRADADTVAEYCKAAHNDGAHGSADMKHVMRVDGFFIVDWCNKRGLTFAQFMRDQSIQKAFMEDPELSMFRIWKGRV